MSSKRVRPVDKEDDGREEEDKVTEPVAKKTRSAPDPDMTTKAFTMITANRRLFLCFEPSTAKYGRTIVREFRSAQEIDRLAGDHEKTTKFITYIFAILDGEYVDADYEAKRRAFPGQPSYILSLKREDLGNMIGCKNMRI